MKQLKMLSLILVALIAMGASCNRPPQPQPTQEGLNGEITTQPITVDGVETGYSLSYRSWIIPGTDENGNKAPTPPKSVYNDNSSDGGAVAASKSFDSRSDASGTKSLAYDAKGGGNSTQNDTISVVLHDTFYHVDTVGYVSTWDPEKYNQGSYTCHWDRYGFPRPGENNITIIDSTAVLRIQFEEFSFEYHLNFEVANYNNGVINQQMPYHVPNVTDLGVEELESLETICRNDSVFARKVLHHSIKVVVGNKTYILQAKVTLYRHMQWMTCSKYIVRSEIVLPFSSTYVPLADSSATQAAYYDMKLITKVYWSDGTSENADLSGIYKIGAEKVEWNERISPYDCNNHPTPTFLGITTGGPLNEFYIFNYDMYPGDYADGIRVKGYKEYTSDIYYDDGYTFIPAKHHDFTLQYSRTEISCESDLGAPYYEMRTYAIQKVDNHPSQEICIKSYILNYP